MGSGVCARGETVARNTKERINSFRMASIVRPYNSVVRFTDHKTVGLQYGLTALVFLLVGFLLMILMRWQLAWPGQALPSWVAPFLGEANAPGGIMLPE